jgi:hypothetical protein
MGVRTLAGSRPGTSLSPHPRSGIAFSLCPSQGVRTLAGPRPGTSLSTPHMLGHCFFFYFFLSEPGGAGFGRVKALYQPKSAPPGFGHGEKSRKKSSPSLGVRTLAGSRPGIGLRMHPQGSDCFLFPLFSPCPSPGGADFGWVQARDMLSPPPPGGSDMGQKWTKKIFF